MDSYSRNGTGASQSICSQSLRNLQTLKKFPADVLDEIVHWQCLEAEVSNVRLRGKSF